VAPSRSADADLRRRLPSVDQVARRPWAAELQARFGRDAFLRELRGLLDEARSAAGAPAEEARVAALIDALPARLAERLRATAASSLRAVINATGVVVHTNLGRAPLPAAAASRVAALATGYSNLEYDLEQGDRGQREVHAETRLRRLLGAEATVVVNNNAAAVLLAVNSFAEGREVIVGRGELVEIGGSFRIPDVLKKGGASLREVGTTNRTRLADYRAALSERTGLILKVHPSNFRVVGFTESVSREELVGLGREAGVPVAEDLGSGLLGRLPSVLAGEVTVAESLAAGVDVVTFSGDKLLGGPQAGLVAGRRAAVDALRKNPLYRALRVDKMTLAALDAVLAEYEAGRAEETVPVLQMLWQGADAVQARAEALAAWLRTEQPEIEATLARGSSAVGGGAAPTAEIPTALLTLRHPSRSAARLAADLRAGEPPVVARIAGERLVLDLRTVRLEEEEALRGALRRAFHVEGQS
jgi:L-seryl-tRNA(Ser) seleniumtransferase